MVADETKVEIIVVGTTAVVATGKTVVPGTKVITLVVGS